MPRLSCAACFHSFRRETESPRSLQGSTPQPEAAPPVAARRTENPISDKSRATDASIATQPSTEPEQTAESVTEAEIKDLCSTIAKTATQLTHANPVERSQLMDAISDMEPALPMTGCTEDESIAALSSCDFDVTRTANQILGVASPSPAAPQQRYLAAPSNSQSSAPQLAPARQLVAPIVESISSSLEHYRPPEPLQQPLPEPARQQAAITAPLFLERDALPEEVRRWLQHPAVRNITAVAKSDQFPAYLAFDCSFPMFSQELCSLAVLRSPEDWDRWILLCRDDASQRVLSLASQACCVAWGLHHTATIDQVKECMRRLERPPSPQSSDVRVRCVYLVSSPPSLFKARASRAKKTLLVYTSTDTDLFSKAVDYLVVQTGCYSTARLRGEVLEDEDGFVLGFDDTYYYEDHGLFVAQKIWFGRLPLQLDICFRLICWGGLIGALERVWASLAHKLLGRACCVGISVGCCGNIGHMYPPSIQLMNMQEGDTTDGRIVMLLIDPFLPKLIESDPEANGFSVWEHRNADFVAIPYPFLPCSVVEDSLMNFMMNLKMDAAELNVVLAPGQRPIDGILDSVANRASDLGIAFSWDRAACGSSTDVDLGPFKATLPEKVYTRGGPTAHVFGPGWNQLHQLPGRD